MANEEQRVRDAAQALSAAIIEAHEAGYRVDWPMSASGLAAIAVSETGRIAAGAKPAPGDEYEVMHKTALVELATARGINVPSGSNKADVIALLKAPITGL